VAQLGGVLADFVVGGVGEQFGELGLDPRLVSLNRHRVDAEQFGARCDCGRVAYLNCCILSVIVAH
jgi:hypothetical protein